MQTKNYTRLLTAIAALGGLLYGYDIGIIGTALLYMDSFKMTESQTGLLASAIMIGALASSVIGGGLADLLGRKTAMILSAMLFAVSVVIIVLSPNFLILFFGRTLQGLSAGMIAVVVPIFMSECLPAKNRGGGATVFQLCITIGIATAMLAGVYYQVEVKTAVRHLVAKNVSNAAATDMTDAEIEKVVAKPEIAQERWKCEASDIDNIKDNAWRMMFLSSVYPAIVFLIAGLAVAESPRWLFRRGHRDRALAVLQKSRSPEIALLEIEEMAALAATNATHSASPAGDSLLSRHYLVPLLLACVLLGINQATGICAVLTFAATMLNQSGLDKIAAGYGAVALTWTNVLATIVGVYLVDRTGRKFLLKLGTAIIVVALGVGVAGYWRIESGRTDLTAALAQRVADNRLAVPLAELAGTHSEEPMQLVVLYGYGGDEQMTTVRSDDADPVLRIAPDDKTRLGATLTIVRAKCSSAPSEGLGYLVVGCLIAYCAGFAVGPGVCLWLMSAELLPTRVRSLGMGVGVLCNALVTIATTSFFLPVVGNWGYAAMWAIWLVCTAAYFLFAAFLLPETKGKTLEEIEEYFRGRTLEKAK